MLILHSWDEQFRHIIQLLQENKKQTTGNCDVPATARSLTRSLTGSYSQIPPLIPAPIVANVTGGPSSSVALDNIGRVHFLHPGAMMPLPENEFPPRFDRRRTNILLTSFYVLFVNCRTLHQFPLQSSVLGEILEHLMIVNTDFNRFRLKRRFRSLFYRQFQSLPLDPVQRHRALFRQVSKPVVGLRLNSIGAFYQAPPGL